MHGNVGAQELLCSHDREARRANLQDVDSGRATAVSEALLHRQSVGASDGQPGIAVPWDDSTIGVPFLPLMILGETCGLHLASEL